MVDQNILRELKNIYEQGNTSFFLGAGISIGNGIPSWKELVTAMYFRYMAAESWKLLKPYPNYLYVASQYFIKRLEESPDIIIRKLKLGWQEYPQEYDEALWDSLYSSRESNTIINSYHINYLPDYIAEVIIKNPSHSKVRSVITYNFDDLMEETFQKYKYRDYQTIYEEGIKIKEEELPVFHVHGYIPFNNNVDKKNYGNIILGEDDYNNLMNDNNNWANLIQLTTLASSANIMIGLSLSDRNLRRILDITSKQSFNNPTYVFLKRPGKITFDQNEISQVHNDAKELLKKWSLGGGIKTSLHMLDEVQQILNGIMQKDYENNARVLEQMKINPIWIDKYEDIAAYLKYMIE